jgi:hypothetical protein
MTPKSDCSEQRDVNVKIKYINVLQIHHTKENNINLSCQKEERNLKNEMK